MQDLKKSMSSYFPLNTHSQLRLRYIQSAVLVLHCIAIIFYIVLSKNHPLQLTKALPMKVHTVKLQKVEQPSYKAPVEQEVATVPVHEEQVTIEQPVIVEQKVVAEPKPTPKKKEVVKPAVKPIKKRVTKPPSPPPPKKPSAQELKKKSLIDKALQSLNSTTPVSSAKKIEHTTPLPQKIGALSTESLLCSVDMSKIDSDRDIGYCDGLIGLLKMMMTLPEKGEVKALLTLSRKGEVISFKIISSKSKKNAAYVKQELPNIHFPVFGNSFPDEASHAFTLILHND